MKIAVVGTGYVGLVTGACLAEFGNTVVCVDTDIKKVIKMQSGQVPIYEPGLETIFKSNIAKKRLSFTTELEAGVKEAEVIFLALPTPPKEDGSADLSFVLGVADALGELLDHYAVVVNKSTVPVGTAESVMKVINEKSKTGINVVSNPEFLREGHAVNDFMHPDRIVIGASSDKPKKIMEQLYQTCIEGGSKIYFMDERSAEITKYAANSMLAAKVSFMNEIANLCERVGANVDAVRMGVGSDLRIGEHFLFAGIGYGGSCFPKDVTALQKTAQEAGYDFKILKAIKDVNKLQKQTIISKINNHYNGELNGKKFALWGLAFKPDTDDIREAPPLAVIEALISKGATVVAYDPKATDNVRERYNGAPGLAFAKDMYLALEDADALIVATEWAEFKQPDFSKVKSKLKAPIIFDGRNIYDLNLMRQTGFYYQSVGRPVVNKDIQT